MGLTKSKFLPDNDHYLPMTAFYKVTKSLVALVGVATTNAFCTWSLYRAKNIKLIVGVQKAWFTIKWDKKARNI